MYLFESESDNSLVIVNSSQLLADEDTVAVGDSVNYVYGKKTYTGIVKFISDNENDIKSKLNDLKNENSLKSGISNKRRRSSRNKDKKTSSSKKSKTSTPKSKEIKKKVNLSLASESSEIEEVEEFDNPGSQATPTLDDSSGSEDADNVDVYFQRYEATKEAEKKAENEAKEIVEKEAKEKAEKEAEEQALKKAAEKAKKKAAKEEEKNTDRKKENAKNKDSSEEDSSDSDDESQLIGAGEPNMKHIGHGIYCQKKICKQAVRGSSAATHVARKLLEGVFKPATLLQCTISGKPATAQGKDRQQEVVVAMNSKAKKAIIDFALKTEIEHNWRPSTREKIISSMSQKLVEIKAVHRKNQNVR